MLKCRISEFQIINFYISGFLGRIGYLYVILETKSPCRLNRLGLTFDLFVHHGALLASAYPGTAVTVIPNSQFSSSNTKLVDLRPHIEQAISTFVFEVNHLGQGSEGQKRATADFMASIAIPRLLQNHVSVLSVYVR